MVNGYYYAAFDSVETQCYDPPPGARSTGDKSYIYTDVSMTNQSIEITDDQAPTNFVADGPEKAQRDWLKRHGTGLHGFGR